MLQLFIALTYAGNLIDVDFLSRTTRTRVSWRLIRTILWTRA